jgi:hypothetical protein
MRILLILCAVALPGAGFATPVFLPTRDVDVTYALSATGRQPANYELRYDAANQLARVDAAAGYYVLGNLPAGQAELIIPAMRALVQAPDFSAMTSQIYNADGAQFTPLGAGHYAGLDCEKYLVLDKNGTGTVCLTPSGVVLHFSGHNDRGAAEVTALSVTFAPQPADLFTPPPGLTPLNLPPGAIAALLNQ